MKRAIHHAVGYIFMLLGLAAALLSVWFCINAQQPTVPAPVGNEYTEASSSTIESFFTCLEHKDWVGADMLLSEGTLGLDREPEDEHAAMLWRLQQNAWSFSPAGEPYLSNKYMVFPVQVCTLDYTALPDVIRASINEQLEQAVNAASRKSEVYDENGGWRQEFLAVCLEQALQIVLGDTQPFLTTRDVEVKTEFLDGQWRIRADAALLGGLTGGAVRAESSESVCEVYGGYVNNLLSKALEGLVTIPMVYKLAESTVVAPKPIKENFGRSKKPADTAEALAAAAPLLDGRELIWSPKRKVVSNTWVHWYQDETILTVVWRERLGGMYFTFCEAVVAHPSQFRRYLADNSFNTRYRYTPTQMTKTVNGVVGISGDFYKYRKLGIVVYQRELYQADGASLDTCFVDANGDLKFVHSGELKNRQAILDYIEANDILFSLAFGPIMIEDGEIVVPKGKYPVGQIQEDYTRCAISQLGKGH